MTHNRIVWSIDCRAERTCPVESSSSGRWCSLQFILSKRCVEFCDRSAHKRSACFYLELYHSLPESVDGMKLTTTRSKKQATTTVTPYAHHDGGEDRRGRKGAQCQRHVSPIHSRSPMSICSRLEKLLLLLLSIIWKRDHCTVKLDRPLASRQSAKAGREAKATP